MRRYASLICLFVLAIGVNIFAEISAQQPLPKNQATKSIQDEDRAARMLAQADKKDAPKAEVHGRGLVKPADLDARIKASWLKHGKKLQALPRVTATSFDCRDMGWVPPFDDQGSCGDCFTGDTMIRMADGTYKRIDQIRIGDLVLTAEGNIYPVTQTMHRTVSENLAKILVAGHYQLEATREHPILTETGYCKISELKPGQFVAIPRYLPGDAETVHVDGSLYRLLVDESPAFPFGEAEERITNQIPLTYGLGRLVGLFVAEGTVSGVDRKVSWAFALKEADTFGAEVVRLCRSELGMEAKLELRPDVGGCRVSFNSANLDRQFLKWFGSGPNNKSIPSCFMSGNREFLAGMLAGWIDGDRQRGESAVTVSHVMALQMHDVANFLGYMPAFVVHTEPKVDSRGVSHQRSWRVGLNNADTYKRGAAKMTDTHLWRKVTAVEEGQFYSGTVYNLEVAGDHSYVANGIGVHNCWVFSGVDPCCAALYKAGKLKSPQTLSKQMALDCYFRDACGGGWPEDAINAVKASGVATDQDYPTAYHANPGSCKTVDPSKILKVLQSGYVAQNGNATYQQLKDAMVRYGVLSICYDADDTPTGPPDKTKVWKGSGGRSIDHAIKVIAFDDSLSPKGAILCWNQWYNDNRDLWWAEYGANGLGDSLMWVDAGDAPTPVPPVPPSPDGAPTITSPLAVVAQTGQPFKYQITATNDPKIFYALPAVEGITVNAVTGEVTGTPTAIGTITVNLVAGNTKGAGQATLTITVSDKPVPPVPPNPTDGFTGSVTTVYKNGVIMSVSVGGGSGLEADLKNAGVSPDMIKDLIKLFSDFIGKQPTNILIGDVLKIFTDLVASDPKAYEAMPKGTP